MKMMLKTTGPALGLLLCFLLPQTARCFYNPQTGRWLSRDPAGEMPGPNLFAFVRNSPLAAVDSLGLDEYNICCCSTDKVKTGRDLLLSAYSKLKTTLEAMSIPHFGKGGSSCSSVNLYIFDKISPTPPCWTCRMEHRQKNRWWLPWPIPRYSDHLAIVCQSHPRQGSGDEILFDYWGDRPAGEDPDLSFRSEFSEPLPAGPGIQGSQSSIDCTGHWNHGFPPGTVSPPTVEK